MRATAPSAGAIGVYWIDGDEEALRDRVDAALRPAPLWATDDALAYGRLVADDGDPIDEVIIARPEYGHRIVTGHGGPAVMDALARFFAARGLVADPGMPPPWADPALRDFNLDAVDRAFADPWSPAAIRAAVDARMPYAKTALQVRFLLTARAHLADRLARLPSDTDPAALNAEVSRAGALLFARQVALAGAPNAGKSALFNALVGHTRALVHRTPGTTLDMVAEFTELGDYAVILHDLPGFHATDSKLERAAQRQALARLAKMDAVLWVVDGSVSPEAPDADEAARAYAREALGAARNLGVVLTKRDLPARRGADDWPGTPTVEVAALPEPGGGAYNTEVQRDEAAVAARTAVAGLATPLLGGGWDGRPWLFTRRQAEARGRPFRNGP